MNPPCGQNCVEGKRVLVLEDEYLIAVYIEDILLSAGAREVVLADRLGEAMKVLAAPEPVDLAILDVRIRGESSVTVAASLLERRVPFVYATGTAATIAIPERLQRIPIIEKPFDAQSLLAALMTAARQTFG